MNSFPLTLTAVVSTSGLPILRWGTAIRKECLKTKRTGSHTSGPIISSEALKSGPQQTPSLRWKDFTKCTTNIHSLSSTPFHFQAGGDFGTFGDEPVKSVSKGKSYGFEVFGKAKDILGFSTILSYTYVISKFNDLDDNLEPLDSYTSTSWDNRHILILTATRNFKHNWIIGAKWRWVGGSPYTLYDYDKSSIKSAGMHRAGLL
jgi:hypothetical protein